MLAFHRPSAASGVPIYVQLKQQIRHAVETGAIRPGESLPTIRALAEQLVINVNTVARVYRELEAEGLISLRQGVGAFVADGAAGAGDAGERIARARDKTRSFLADLQAQGLTPDEIRRLVQIAIDELAYSSSPVPVRERGIVFSEEE